MREALGSVALLALLVGCGSPTVGVARAGGAPRRAIEPRLDATTPLSLERFGRRLRVGDDAAAASEIFPRQQRSFEFRDLPERLQGDFEARGWETRDEGFGVILYSGRVAAAVRQFYGISAARYEELVATVRSANSRAKSRSLRGENVQFTFYEADPQILMILRRGIRQDAYDVTIALGDKAVMDILDMTPAKGQGIIDRLSGDPTAGTPGDGPVRSPAARRGADGQPKTP